MPLLATEVPRLQTVTGVAPSATANTYGTATDIWPSRKRRGILVLFHAALTSGGTFGAETLTVRIRTRHRDTAANSVTKTFTATGGETALTNAELWSLHTDEKMIERLSIDCQSNIASSTATAGLKVGFINAYRSMED